MERLEHYAWPGNVRELEHLVQRALLLGDGLTIEVSDLGLGLAADSPNLMPQQGFISMDQFNNKLVDEEKRYLEKALEATNGVIYGKKGVAQLLGVHSEKLRARMKKLGVESVRRGLAR
jgi:formate hydrogenlyase transcriptional activator